MITSHESYMGQTMYLTKKQLTKIQLKNAKLNNSVKMLMSATLVMALSACGGDSSDDKKDEGINAVLGYDFDVESPDSKDKTNVLQKQFVIEKSIPITKSTSLLNKTLNKEASNRFKMTDKAIYASEYSRDANGVEKFNDQLVTKYDNQVLELTNSKDKEYKITYQFFDKDISNKEIQDVIKFNHFETDGRLGKLPSTQNTFGSNQSCKAIRGITVTKDIISFSSIVEANQTKANFDAYIAKNISGTKLGDTWQDVPWSVSRDTGKGFALYKNNIWSINFEDKTKKSKTFTLADKDKIACFVVNKEQADFVAKAVKSAYGVK